jgi:hypothetical protein
MESIVAAVSSLKAIIILSGEGLYFEDDIRNKENRQGSIIFCPRHYIEILLKAE